MPLSVRSHYRFHQTKDSVHISSSSFSAQVIARFFFCFFFFIGNRTAHTLFRSCFWPIVSYKWLKWRPYPTTFKSVSFCKLSLINQIEIKSSGFFFLLALIIFCEFFLCVIPVDDVYVVNRPLYCNKWLTEYFEFCGVNLRINQWREVN